MADYTGTTGNDSHTGDGTSETIRGDDGDDILNGAGDVDYITGGAGADDVSGGDGDDIIHGHSDDEATLASLVTGNIVWNASTNSFMNYLQVQSIIQVRRQQQRQQALAVFKGICQR